MNLKRILITGSSGFVGKHLIDGLLDNGFEVTGASRTPYKPQQKYQDSYRWVKWNLLSNDNDYESLFDNTETVIHLAAYVHVRGHNAENISKFRSANVIGTKKLLNEASRRGVKKFIFLSTVGIHGNFSNVDKTFEPHRYVENDSPAPHNSYSVSKYEAEQEINDFCANENMNYLIFRPPLIYGPYVKSNFLNLMQLLSRRIPLPLGNVMNSRSLLYIGNLVDATLTVLENNMVNNKTYLVSDHDISTPELICRISDAMKIKHRLFNFPQPLLKIMLSVVGRKKIYESLTGTLLIDSSAFQSDMHWLPRYSLEEGIDETVKVFMDNQKLYAL